MPGFESWEAATQAEIFRGGSKRPLYVTAVGTDLDDAAQHIRNMMAIFGCPACSKGSTGSRKNLWKMNGYL